jgi:hypothetical protein
MLRHLDVAEGRKFTMANVRPAPVARWSKLPCRAASVVLAVLLLTGCGGPEPRALEHALPESAGPLATGVHVLARSGQRAPDGRGRIEGLGRPFLNNRGQAVFIADVDVPGADLYEHAILRSDRPGALDQLARTGMPLAGTDGTFGWLSADEDLCTAHRATAPG